MKKLVVLATVVLVFSLWATPQTKNNKSAVGTWQLDLARSDFGAQSAPKEVMLTILQDTPQMLSWRIQSVDDSGNSYTFSWSGPTDGSVHPISAQDSTPIGTESVKREPDGSLVRHGEINEASFDARSTMSDDGNTITDEITQKSKDGKENKSKRVYRRVPVVKK
jgi:hypothetical protein